MKNLISISIFLLAILLSTSCLKEVKTKTADAIDNAAKVEVYYFHYSRRCATCQAVETESQKIVKELYAKQFKAGEIKFIGVDLDEKSSDAIAKKCKVAGQALLVMSDKKRVDLTQQGFMYARSNPEKLKEEIKKVIDPLLK